MFVKFYIVLEIGIQKMLNAGQRLKDKIKKEWEE